MDMLAGLFYYLPLQKSVTFQVPQQTVFLLLAFSFQIAWPFSILKEYIQYSLGFFF